MKLSAKALLLINTELGAERNVLEKLNSIQNVKEVHLTYGVYDIILIVDAETQDKLKETITYKIRALPRHQDNPYNDGCGLRPLIDRPILGEIECDILIELLFSPDCKTVCREIRYLSNIGDSTWNKEKKSLRVVGLIEIEGKKEFDIDGRVTRHKVVKLTRKGKLVACLLVNISNVLLPKDESLIDEDVQVLRNPSPALQV